MKKVLALTAVWFLLLAAFNILPAQGLDVIKEETISTSSGKTLDLSMFAGDILISTWNKSEVGVKLSGNDNAKEVLDYKSSKDGDNVKIEVKSNKKNQSNIEIKLELQVPADYNIDAKTAGGDISLSGLNGNIEFKTAGGDVLVNDLKGNAEVKTAGGDVSLKSVTGSVDVTTAGGDIIIASSDGKIESKTAGGDILVEYTGSNNGIECKTSGGDIRLTLPDSFAANFELKTSSGEIKSDFPLDVKEKYGNAKAVGSVNGGGSMVECATNGGDIVIKKK